MSEWTWRAGGGGGGGGRSNTTGDNWGDNCWLSRNAFTVPKTTHLSEFSPYLFFAFWTLKSASQGKPCNAKHSRTTEDSNHLKVCMLHPLMPNVVPPKAKGWQRWVVGSHCTCIIFRHYNRKCLNICDGVDTEGVTQNNNKWRRKKRVVYWQLQSEGLLVKGERYRILSGISGVTVNKFKTTLHVKCSGLFYHWVGLFFYPII